MYMYSMYIIDIFIKSSRFHYLFEVCKQILVTPLRHHTCYISILYHDSHKVMETYMYQ